MNRIVLVGNGFDLHNGLDTDYESFIDWYLMKALTTAQTDHNKASDRNFTVSDTFDINTYDPPDLNNLAERIKKRILEGQATVQFANDKNQLDFKIKISSILQVIYRDLENIGWSDIEAVYFRLLAKRSTPNDTAVLNACFEDLRGNLIEYLENQVQDLQTDNNFSSLFITSEIAVQNRSFLNLHLDEFSEKQKKMISEPDDKNRDEGLYDKIYLINFNYTSYWHSQFCNFTEKELEIINIHGLLKDKKENPPFFGYGDDTSEEYKEVEKRVISDHWAKYMKSIHYLRRYEYKQLLDIIDTKPYQVVIAGHSCGMSDKTLLKTVFEHKNCVSIKPYFYKEKDEDGQLTGKDNWLSLMANISRIFSDNAMMRDRVMSRYDKEGLERALSFDFL